ncbi:MAG: hypothetical protein FWG31_07425 [Oscillospiraceae bacterium]|nr:hypothetical protein [Oscillospiraceae bacterium]
MGKLFDRFMTGLSAGWLRFCYATSKVTQEGSPELLYGEEGFAVSFWHGDSYCYFPQLQHRGDIIITTVDKRGNVVEMLGRKFGFDPYRLPDESVPDVSLVSLRRMLADTKGKHICFSMDGPLGPYHVPQRFFLTLTFLAKKRVLPVSIQVKRKIRLKRRWDKYMIPLPFSRMTFTVHPPLEVHKKDFDTLPETIRLIMDGEPRLR